MEATDECCLSSSLMCPEGTPAFLTQFASHITTFLRATWFAESIDSVNPSLFEWDVVPEPSGLVASTPYVFP